MLQLAGGAQRDVAAEIVEQHALHALERGEERAAEQTREESDERRVKQCPADDLELERRFLRYEQREDVANRSEHDQLEIIAPPTTKKK